MQFVDEIGLRWHCIPFTLQIMNASFHSIGTWSTRHPSMKKLWRERDNTSIKTRVYTTDLHVDVHVWRTGRHDKNTIRLLYSRNHHLGLGFCQQLNPARVWMVWKTSNDTLNFILLRWQFCMQKDWYCSWVKLFRRKEIELAKTVQSLLAKTSSNKVKMHFLYLCIVQYNCKKVSVLL